ncbi:hypothetical protein [Dongia sp. agr-C8]
MSLEAPKRRRPLGRILRVLAAAAIIVAAAATISLHFFGPLPAGGVGPEGWGINRPSFKGVWLSGEAVSQAAR